MYHYGLLEAATRVLKIAFLGLALPPRKKKKKYLGEASASFHSLSGEVIVPLRSHLQ